MKTLQLIISIAGALAAHAAILRGPVTNSANGHVYYLLAQATWTQSEDEAISLGGHLVTISDEAENNWVYDTFSLINGAPIALWLGLNDQLEEGKFVWASGQTSSYTHWSQGQPDNGGGGEFPEHFVHMWFPGFNPGYVTDRYWNDLPDLDSVHETPVCGVVEIEGEQPLLSIRCSQVELCWSSRTNRTYQLQYKSAITTNTWVDSGNPIVGTGTNICITDAIAVGQPQRLYRLRTLP
jgi:hypothetical protein